MWHLQQIIVVHLLIYNTQLILLHHQRSYPLKLSQHFKLSRAESFLRSWQFPQPVKRSASFYGTT